MSDFGSDLRRGQRIVLAPAYPGAAERFAGYIEELRAGQLTIAPLTPASRASDFALGQTVRAKVPEGEGETELILSVTGVGGGPDGTVTVSLPSEGRPRERRRFVRISSEFPVRAALLTADGGSLGMPSASGTDLSGGGAQVLIPRGHSHELAGVRPGRPMRLRLMLPPVGDVPGSSFQATGRVISLTESAEGWRVGIRFDDLGARQREELIRWCFAEQRRLLRASQQRPRRTSR